MGDCSKDLDLSCRNKTTALHLKIGAIAAIAVASTLGVALPLVGRRLKAFRTDGNFFFVTKAFAAGVILATGFCHMLPDAQEALTNPCLPENPWAKFPWQGFIAMVAALATLVLDFVGTEYYQRKYGVTGHGHGHSHGMPHNDTALPSNARIGNEGEFDTLDGGDAGTAVKGDDIESKGTTTTTKSNNSGQMHIVGMRAHAASHSHSHADGQHGTVEGGHHAGHQHESKTSVTDADLSLRHVVISQVLELGIVAHSVIIGLTLGVSESPCTIRPLMAALVFHQFFEGFALGGCISQAGFKRTTATIMAFFFSITTPFGICLGLGIATSYNENSPHALIVEGVFDAISAGILIYMALVDLIAADFLSKRLRCDRQLQVFSYLALFLGSGAMSAIAIWA